MLTLEQVPAAWLDVLRRVQVHAPGAVLAGGALRDLHHGRPVKDLDIFMPSEGWERFDELLDAFDGWVARTIPGEYRDTGSDIGSIAEVDTPAGIPPVNFISIKGAAWSLDAALRRFDFGLCQIGTDGRRLVYTEAYNRDWRQATLTLVRSDTKEQFDRSMERFTRLSAKYPNHRLVIPGDFDLFAGKVGLAH